MARSNINNIDGIDNVGTRLNLVPTTELRIENYAAPCSYGRSVILNSQFSILNLPTAYAPNIAYISAIAHSVRICIDASEPYVRQTFRNHCEILTSQGVKKLSIPIEKKSTQTGTIKDVKIDYAENWQRQHWRTLQTAYNNSPYFLYYQDELKNFYDKKYEFLVDFNIEILFFLLKKINIQTDIRRGVVSAPHPENGQANPALTGHPFQNFVKYQQVFTPEKFIPNLSSFDLLFNCGPESKSHLCKA